MAAEAVSFKRLSDWALPQAASFSFMTLKNHKVLLSLQRRPGNLIAFFAFSPTQKTCPHTRTYARTAYRGACSSSGMINIYIFFIQLKSILEVKRSKGLPELEIRSGSTAAESSRRR